MKYEDGSKLFSFFFICLQTFIQKLIWCIDLKIKAPLYYYCMNIKVDQKYFRFHGPLLQSLF